MIILGLDKGAGDEQTAVGIRSVDGRFEIVRENDGVPICRDMDEDCAELNHLHCYLYDPAKGKCPFLSPEFGRISNPK